MAKNNEPPDGPPDRVYHNYEGYNSDCTTDLPNRKHSNLSPYSQSYDNHEPQLVSHVETTRWHRPGYLACGFELIFGINLTIASRLTEDQALSKRHVVHLEGKEEGKDRARHTNEPSYTYRFVKVIGVVVGVDCGLVVVLLFQSSNHI